MGVVVKGAGIAFRQLCLPWRVPCDRSYGTDAERFGGAAEGMEGSRASEASEGWKGIGGNQEPPSERSERGSAFLRTRMRARVPRRRVRAIPLYIGVLGGFVVCFSV